MAKREWIGNYKLHYVEYHSYKNEWIARTADLGRCLCNLEAMNKAVDFIIRENLTVDYSQLYITDGWGNKFYALEG